MRLNTLRPGQDGCQFPDDIFKYIFLNENIWISIEISLKFVLKGPINNISALVQIMARRPARGQAIIWTNDDKFTDAYASLGLNELMKTFTDTFWPTLYQLIGPCEFWIKFWLRNFQANF